MYTILVNISTPHLFRLFQQQVLYFANKKYLSGEIVIIYTVYLAKRNFALGNPHLLLKEPPIF